MRARAANRQGTRKGPGGVWNGSNVTMSLRSRESTEAGTPAQHGSEGVSGSRSLKQLLLLGQSTGKNDPRRDHGAQNTRVGRLYVNPQSTLYGKERARNAIVDNTATKVVQGPGKRKKQRERERDAREAEREERESERVAQEQKQMNETVVVPRTLAARAKDLTAWLRNISARGNAEEP